MEISRRALLALTGASALSALSGCAINYPVTVKAKALSWWHPAGSAELDAALAAWGQEFDAHLSVSSVTDYPKMLAATLPTLQGPDVYEAVGLTPSLVTKELVTDLSAKVAGTEFVETVLDGFTYRDKVYAIPHAVDGQFIAYRKSVLTKAEVATPKTFAELVDVAKATTTESKGGFYAGPDRGLPALGYALVWASGSQLIDAAGKCGFVNRQFFDAVAAFRAASDLNSHQPTSNWDDPTPLINGEVALQWVGSWRLPELQDKLADDISVIPFPGMVDPAHRVVPISASGTSVRPGKNVEAAIKFVQWLWLEQTDKQIKYADSFGCRFPAKTALFDKCTHLTSGVGQTAAAAVKASAKSVPMAWTATCANHFFSALTQSMKMDADPAAIFTEAAKAIDAELA